MSVEIIGLLYHQIASQIYDPPTVDFDLNAIHDLALAHEASGYDSVLVSQNGHIPDPLMIGAYVAGITTKLRFMLAHRPGFVAPTMAARQFATIDQLSAGRASIHIISGAADVEMLRDGDRLTKDQRYRRSREYTNIMRRVWSADAPFDHEGEFYRLHQAFSTIKPTRPSGLPISWAGVSPLAFETAGECADVYAMIGDGPDTAKEFADRATAEAARHGRKLGFTITLCVILGDTEEAAWRNAHDVRDRIMARMAARKAANPAQAAPDTHASAAIQRLLLRANETDIVGKNIWMGINKATGMATGNNTTVVGTVEQVTETLMLYRDIGFTGFLLRGFEPLRNAVEFGVELIPHIRAETARRDQHSAHHAGLPA
jgi:alkanesulfonate monooxygenase